MSRAVVIRWCASTEEAVVIRSALASQGFQVELGNIHHAMMDWFMIPALGGVDVRVAEQDSLAADQALTDLALDADETLKDAFPDLTFEPLHRKRWPIWLTAFLFYEVAFLLMLLHAMYRFIYPARYYGVADGPSRHL